VGGPPVTQILYLGIKFRDSWDIYRHTKAGIDKFSKILGAATIYEKP
jgi:hypothetical protein